MRLRLSRSKMPKQNRVTPFGAIIATPERGTVYGNRGCIVNSRGEISRRFNGIRWISCLLEFKNRRHPVMAPGRYTGLFFLDEATALAAGHRPCAECRRERFDLFRRYWAKANFEEAGSHRPLAPVIDTVLHKERLGPRYTADSINELPDGTFISDHGANAYVVSKNRLFLWTPGGYRSPVSEVRFPAQVLTPRSIVKTLRAGYPVTLHFPS
jgi:hypothetical protein